MEGMALKKMMRSDPIETLELSTRAFNVLKRYKIDTVGDLIVVPEDSLMHMRNMGVKSVSEIRSALSEIELIEDIPERSTNDCENKDAINTFMAQNGEIYYDIPIKDLSLSKHTNNCMKSAGISYFSELLLLTETDLLSLPSIGRKSVSEIILIQKNTELRPISKQSTTVPDFSKEKELLAQLITQSVNKTITVNVGFLYKKLLILLNQSNDVHNLNYPPILKLQEEIINLTYLRNILKSTITSRLEKSFNGIAFTELKKIFPDCFSDEKILINLLSDMEQEGIVVRRNEEIYERKYISVCQYALSLCGRDQYVLQERLNGKTLDDIGKEMNITRERIRQIIASILRRAPTFAEDRYAALYQKYDISKSDYLELFKFPSTTYNYLNFAYKRGDVSISELEMDDDMPEEFKEIGDQILHKNCVILNGECVSRTRTTLCEYVLRTIGLTGITFEEFIQRYNMLLENIGEQDNPKLTITERTYENKLATSNHVLWKLGKKLRYYNIDSYDFKELFDTLDLSQYHNVEYSTLKFFREYPELMKDYDIQDEYELHNLLKKICKPGDFPDMHIRRMPHIEFGIADRDAQIKELLISLAPVKSAILAEAYENEYGVLAQTVIGTYLNNFSKYHHAGIYSINVPTLPENMVLKLRQQLVNDFYLLSEIKAIYIATFPKADPSLLNPYTIKQLEYNVHANYAISNRYTSAGEYFRFLLVGQDNVDAQTFPNGILGIHAYISELSKLKSSYEIIEYEPQKYVSISCLSKANVNVTCLYDFCNKVALAGENKYFTIFSLRQTGFSHYIDDLGFEEWFYSSLLAEDKTHFSCRRIGNNRLFQCGIKPVYFAEFLEWLLNSQETQAIDIFDFVTLLKDGFNIFIEPYKIIEAVKDTTMYYDSITKKIYANYTVYFEEI